MKISLWQSNSGNASRPLAVWAHNGADGACSARRRPGQALARTSLSIMAFCCMRRSHKVQSIADSKCACCCELLGEYRICDVRSPAAGREHSVSAVGVRSAIPHGPNGIHCAVINVATGPHGHCAQKRAHSVAFCGRGKGCRGSRLGSYIVPARPATWAQQDRFAGVNHGNR